MLIPVFFWDPSVPALLLRHNIAVLIEQVWEKNQHLFRSIVFAITNKSEDIDDILQETYRRILNSPTDLNDPEEAFYYLKKCIRNTAIDWNRRYFRRHLTVKEQVSDYDRLEELRTTGETPLSRLLEKEGKNADASFVEEVFLAVEELPMKHREAVKSFFSIGGAPSPKQFSAENRIPYSTLRSRMVRGIDLIRDILAEKNVHGFVKEPPGTLLGRAEKRTTK